MPTLRNPACTAPACGSQLFASCRVATHIVICTRHRCSVKVTRLPTLSERRRHLVVRGQQVGRGDGVQAKAAMQDGPINFEAFKWHQQLQGDPDRRLYVLHAHTYFPYSTDSDKAKASKFRAAVQSQFEGVQAVKISDISPEAVGPHPMPEFELAFTKPCLEKILPWLIFNRPEDYSILVHPFTSDVVADHDTSAVWLGKNLGANLQPLIDLQQVIKQEVKAGRDEDALLWPFIYAEINSQSDLQ